jgi:hypothetical protein
MSCVPPPVPPTTGTNGAGMGGTTGMACAAVGCANPCPTGYKPDANGCPTCTCN